MYEETLWKYYYITWDQVVIILILNARSIEVH